MAQIGMLWLKRGIIHMNSAIYETKDELGGAKCAGIVIKDGRTGYIPLTQDIYNGYRNPHILCNDGQNYHFAEVKNNSYTDIVSCKIILSKSSSSGDASFGEISSNKLSTTSYGHSNLACKVDFCFYDKNGNDLTSHYYYIKHGNIKLTLNYSIYYSGYGGSVYVMNQSSDVITTTSNTGYANNKSFTTSFGAGYDLPYFYIFLDSSNSSRNCSCDFTLNSLTFNGKKLPITNMIVEVW